MTTAEELYSFRNLWRQYRLCRRNKRNTVNALRFEVDAEAKLLELQRELREHTYRPGPSICFVSEGAKPREVFAADFRDRIVHHVLVSYQERVLEPRFIHDSYACRKGKGVLAASDCLMRFLRRVTVNGRRPAWALKLDVASFFPSIDKQTLDAIIARQIHDPEVLWLTRVLLFHDPTVAYRFHSNRRAAVPPEQEGYRIPPRKSLFGNANTHGLPIGNLTSQFWANVYLNELDQFVKRQLKCRSYVRYVDDMVLLSTSREQLLDWKRLIAEFLGRALRLQLRPDTREPSRLHGGIDFVGWKTFWDHRLPRRQTVRNCAQRLLQFERTHVHRVWDGAARRVDVQRSHREVTDLNAALASYSGHLRHGASWRQWREMLEAHGWVEALVQHSPCDGWRVRDRWPAGTLVGTRFSKQYGRLIRRAGDRALVFCQVGRFVEFYGPQREVATRVLGLLRVKMSRGGYAFSVGFPASLTHVYVSRAVRAGYAVADVRELGQINPSCAERAVVAVWAPRGAARIESD